jgi:hypothetical protein
MPISERLVDFALRHIRRGYEYHARQMMPAGLLGDVLAFKRERPDADGPQLADLLYIYWQVRRRKPFVVLEFGSGFSTLVIARALQDNGQGFLYSVDTNQQWADSNWWMLPEACRDWWCSITVVPVTKSTVEGTPVLLHDFKPPVPPDMVYLDGPWFEQHGGDIRIAADLIYLEPRLRPGFFLLIDDRQENTRFLREHLKRRYRFGERLFIRQQTAELLI